MGDQLANLPPETDVIIDLRGNPGGRLAEADAFASIGLARRDALWQVRAIRGPAPLPLFATSYDGEGIDDVNHPDKTTENYRWQIRDRPVRISEGENRGYGDMESIILGNYPGVTFAEGRG